MAVTAKQMLDMAFRGAVQKFIERQLALGGNLEDLNAYFDDYKTVLETIESELKSAGYRRRAQLT